jgi:hypothetical protein
MRFINLCRHAVVLRLTDGLDRTIESSGEARVDQAPGELLDEVPVEPERYLDRQVARIALHASSTYARIVGLPESVEPGTRLIVPLIVAQRACIEYAAIAERVRVARIRAEQHGRPFTDEERAIVDRGEVLAACCAPGTGPADGAVRWTTADHEAGACRLEQVGQIRAVTRLVVA